MLSLTRPGSKRWWVKSNDAFVTQMDNYRDRRAKSVDKALKAQLFERLYGEEPKASDTSK